MPISDHLIHLENGKLAADTPRDIVDAIAHKAVEHAGAGGIAIHFHGGLVNEARGREIAERLSAEYADKGEAYPIFFVWESGLVETVRNNLGEIAKEVLFERVWKRVEQMVLRKFAQSDGDRAAGTLPPVDTTATERAIERALRENDDRALRETAVDAPSNISEMTEAERTALEHELALDPVLVQQTQLISNGLRTPAEIEADSLARTATVRGSTTTLMDPDTLDRLVDRPQPGDRGLLTTAKLVKEVVAIAARVIHRFVRKRDHGLHATVIEEILRALYLANAGALVWRTIKKDTADAFEGDGSVHGGTALLEALEAATADGAAPRITLVGHSTGAIFISEFLDKAVGHLPDETKYGIVFLAPASTFDATAETLEKHGDRIAGFRMFSMTDENERGDRLVPVLYPHSLLYFVSGVVEDTVDEPLVGMQRFYDAARFAPDDFPSVDEVRRFIDEEDHRAVWSISGDDVDGLRTSSLKHGDFDNDPATLGSVSHILSRGFMA